MNRYYIKTIVPLLIALLFLIKILMQIMVLAKLGYTNQADFFRNIHHLGIGFNNICTAFPKVGFCTDYITIKPIIFKKPQDGFSTAQFFIFISRVFYNIINGNNGYFSILYTGVLYAVIYAMGYFSLIRKINFNNVWTYILFIATSFIILSDLVFTSYFNSFFDEPAFIVVALCFTASFIYYRNATIDILLCLMIILAKHQNMIFFLLIPLIYNKYSKPNFKKYHWLIIIIGSIFIYYSHLMAVKSFFCLNSSSSLFSGLLRHEEAPQAAKILNNFGLPAEFAKYSGFTYFGNSTPTNISKAILFTQDRGTICEHVRSGTIIINYLSHPMKMATNLIEYLSDLDKFGPYTDYSRNTPATNPNLYEKSYFSAIVLTHMRFIVILLSIISLMLIKIYKKQIASEPLLILFLGYFGMSILSLMICIIGDGFADIIRHGLEFYFLICLAILLVILQIPQMINKYITNFNIGRK